MLESGCCELAAAYCQARKSANSFWCPVEDPPALGRIDVRGTVANKERATEHQCIGAWKHVQQSFAATDGEVIDVEVRRQEQKMPLDRREFRIAKELRGAEPCAIEDHRFGERQHVRAVDEIANHEHAAGLEEIIRHATQESRRFDQHGHGTPHVRYRKGMLIRV